MHKLLTSLLLTLLFISSVQASITLAQNTPYTELGAKTTDSAGNEANITRSVEVINSTPMLSSITLESNATHLNVGDTVTLSVVGTYADNSSKTLTSNIEYLITPSQSVRLSANTLEVLKDGSVTVQAKVGNTLSNKVNLDITWVVDGHVLPPEPDPAVNNATLLGVDVNDNGVRDDVERWIYREYKDKHPIYIDIAMQAARGYKLVLETPEKAKEIHNEVNKALDCQMYYELDADECNEPILVKEHILNEYFRSKIYFNTKVRMEAYDQYDRLLSGDSYTLSTPQEEKAACDFNTIKYIKE